MRREKHLGLRVEAEIYDKLKYIAKYEGRSLSGQIIYLALQCIRLFERDHGVITQEELTRDKDA